MEEATPFSRRTVSWIVAVGVTAFAAMLFILLFAQDSSRGSMAGPHPYSESAIGHRAFVTFLDQMDVPVVVSRNESLFDKMQTQGFRVLLEPPSNADLRSMMFDIVGGEAVLLVLPKWQGFVDPDKHRWVEAVEPVSIDHVRDILGLVAEDPEIVRPGEGVQWTSSTFKAVPAIAQPQLIRSSDMTPLVESDQGVLLGMVEAYGVDVYVLSDPDVMNNHGLGEGDNARFMLEAVDFLRTGTGAVVIDATLHGFTRSINPWRSLFELPLLPVTLLGIGLVFIVFWAGAVRFGRPAPAPRVLEPGKRGLVDNTAQLMDFGGNFQMILRGYLDASARRVALGLNAPRDLEMTDLGQWFDRAAEARGIEARFARLRADVNALVSMPNTELRRMFAAAHEIYRWKKEMLRGSRKD